ncbi:MAG: protein jag [Clostridiales bacterium]|nr:protein jag [Clostridiales bacterium]
MSHSVERTGKTVQEAISLALQDLNVDRENAEIEVLDEGSKGLFGLGGKVARVRVTVVGTRADEAKGFLEDILAKMKVDVDVEADEDEEAVLVKIKGKDSGIIIGRRGETLDAIQYLTGLVVNKDKEDYKRVTVDIENYRQKREETLINLANRLAERVVKYRKNVTLEPMNPYERRIIHSSLQNNKMVETFSVGEEPNRKVVISIKQNAGFRKQQ